MPMESDPSDQLASSLSHEVPSGNSPETDDSIEADALLSECFAKAESPLGEVDADKPPTMDWRYLALCQSPHVVASASLRLRCQNAAWTRWAEAQRLCMLWEQNRRNSFDVLPELLFPATPTSSTPGTPRQEEHFATFGVPQVVPMVNMMVPLHIAPQVHAYIQELLRGSIGMNTSSFGM